ncbi:hypothetical protein AKJ37_06215 [candidate division MSBL1 archaeon SCGC-AAA259I09]|uniref:Uncharacterized protein n=2 Tax=candidate division MSBL1 TaxID=215777 RepID=A0A133UP92_9EURY|nr:hypothetical protein AKJ37_06215 [candidate division MSBL1 archaeon SCGC-AAA259I09]
MDEEHLSFKTYVKKANSRGTGFFHIPDRFSDKFQVGDQVSIKIHSEETVKYSSKIRNWGGLGVYVPKKIAGKYNLNHSTCKIEINKLNGFHAKIGSDGRVYIPNRRGKKLNLDEEKIIEIEGRIKGKNETVFWPVNVREKENTVEYRIIFDKRFAGEEGVFRIEEVYDVSSEKEKISKDLRKVLKPFDWIVPDDTVRVFDGSKVPVQMSSKLDLSDISYYLGAYFADGTKKGNSWGIAASTFQQAKFYRKSHRFVFKNADLDYQLSYTFNPASRNKNKSIVEKWKKETGIQIGSIRKLETETRNAENRNKFGSLYIREHKLLVREIYVEMLSALLKKITETHDRRLAWNFLLGVLEGDGAPKSKKHCHIEIVTNVEEIDRLQRGFDVLRLDGEIYRKGDKGRSINIGSLELICNLELIGDKLFHLYPKRRRKTIRRLLDTGAARFILGKQESTAGWVKNYLKEGGILNERFNLTDRGRKIRGKLGEMSEELP